MTADTYLRQILDREAVDTGILSPVRGVQLSLDPVIREWANQFLIGVRPIGSFAKGTANKTGTDIDLFISLSSNTPETLREIYTSLCNRLRDSGYAPKRQNVSINVRVGSYDVDLVPGKRQALTGDDHSLYRRRADTWIKTNVQTHIAHVSSAGCLSETRIIKLWRDQKGLDFPSFYLELAVIRALGPQIFKIGLAANVWNVFEFLANDFTNARLQDPANTNNIISDDLTVSGRRTIQAAASRALRATTWGEIIV